MNFSLWLYFELYYQYSSRIQNWTAEFHIMLMKWINSAGTTTGAEGLQDGAVCAYFEELSDKNKRQYKLQTSKLISCLPQANQMFTVDLLLNCESKGYKSKHNLCSFSLTVDPWYPEVILFAMDDVKKGWLDLRLWKLSTVLTLWTRALKHQIISVTEVRNIVTKIREFSVISFYLNVIVKIVKLK